MKAPAPAQARGAPSCCCLRGSTTKKRSPSPLPTSRALPPHPHAPFLSFSTSHTHAQLCRSPEDAAETKSRRVSSSRSWSSVSPPSLFGFAPFFLTPRLLARLASPGASGTGRTTFVNTLCESEVLGHKISDEPSMAHVEEGIRIKPANVGESRHALFP